MITGRALTRSLERVRLLGDSIKRGDSTPDHQSLRADVLADGDLSRSLQWDGVLKRYGVSDVLSAVFADKHGYWGGLTCGGWTAMAHFPSRKPDTSLT